jgi:hypothetical protein
VTATSEEMTMTQAYKHDLRSIYQGMCRRCADPRRHEFHKYGARGISVAEEWIGPGGFERFAAHIGPRPSREHSVDRIDNALGYAPGNVRWATAKEQTRNTRRNIVVTIEGKTQTLAAWIEDRALNSGAVRRRIENGWDAVLAITTPVRSKARSGEGRQRPRSARERDGRER